ncbi:MAG: TonB-dependent receptor, partial [Bacteroidota bacterium]
METALVQLSEVADVDIAFSSDFFPPDSSFSFSVQNTSVEEILEKILQETRVEWKATGTRILLFRKKRKNIVISGFLEDNATGERLISALVYDPERGIGTTTNEYGFYSLTLPEGAAEMRYSYLGYEKKALSLNLKRDVRKNVRLTPTLTLSGITITPNAGSDALVESDESRAAVLNSKLVKAAPALAGEDDYVRAAQLLPGIDAGIDGLGGLVVRGGDAGHNLLLLDGAPVYFPYHSLGALSVFNSSSVKSAKLLKGTFPSRFGGQLAAVMDVRTREGNLYEWHGEAGVNLINAKVLVEGPLIEDRASLMVAARYSPTWFLFDPTLRKTFFQDKSDELYTSFYDLNAKLNYRISARDRIYLSIFRSFDEIYN